MTEEPRTLRTGNYVIDLSDGPSVVSRLEEKSGHKEWICTCPDPEAAMIVVEGLILVENKRFYYPEATPTVKFDQKQAEKTHPNFLDRKSD
jgi:hypothetical protein